MLELFERVKFMSDKDKIPRPGLITFDFGETIVTSDPPYFARIAMSLNELGFDHTHSQVEEAYHRADFRHAPEILKQAPFDNETYISTFSQVLLEELKITDDTEKIFKELSRVLVAFRPERVVIPGARELLEKLKEKGFKLAVISNNDGRTKKKCKDVGIEKYFDLILDSTVEGIMKPDPRIFHLALEKTGVEKEKALHVGDLWGSDILGAHNAGMWAIWLKKPFLQPPDLPGTASAESISDITRLIQI
jgi:putative hydrolase of the HAD superfamily